MAPFVPPVPDMDLIRLIWPITDRPFRRSCELLDSPSSPRHEVQELSLLLQTTPAEQQPSSRHVGTPSAVQRHQNKALVGPLCPACFELGCLAHLMTRASCACCFHCR